MGNKCFIQLLVQVVRRIFQKCSFPVFFSVCNGMFIFLNCAFILLFILTSLTKRACLKYRTFERDTSVLQSLSLQDHSHCCETSQHFNCDVPIWVTYMFKVSGHKHRLCIQASRTKRSSRQTMELECKTAVRIRTRGEVHITCDVWFSSVQFPSFLVYLLLYSIA